MADKGKDKIFSSNVIGPELGKVAEFNMNEMLLRLSDPQAYELDFDQEIRHSTLYDSDLKANLNNIVQAFNQGKESIVTSSSFGKIILPGEFRIVTLNNVPEIVPPSDTPKRKKIFLNPRKKTKEIGTFNQSQLFIGGYGSYIVNVPNGKIAKVWINNEPVLLASGCHVIHDPTFRPVNETHLVDYGAPLIQHGTYVIVRIAPTTCGKIFINNTPYFLISREKPYVFKHPAIIVPEQYISKLTSPIINHGNFNIMQIPKGKVAKVWLDPSTPDLLESRREPYIFTSPGFQIQKASENDYFVNTSDQQIIHGPIKRILPRTGEVAVTYNGGQLITYGPSEDNNPIVITSPNHIVDMFLPINIQTMQFPSESTKKKRKEENASSDKDVDYMDVNYEVFRTCDGLPIGVKLLVVYEIKQPNLTLTKLKPDKIIQHIEYLVSANMALVVQHCNSIDFLKSNQIVKKDNNKDEPEFYAQIQDRVFHTLKQNFETYGIELHRLNIETPKILDQKIAEEMAKFSLQNTETQAKEAVIGKQTQIAKQEAEKNAAVTRIIQEQENSNKINTAKADYEATKLKQEAILLEAQTQTQAKQMLLEIEEKRAQMFDKHRALFEFELAKIHKESMIGIQSTIISPEIASLYFGPGLNSMLPRREKNS